MGFESIFPLHRRQACRAWVCLCAIVALSAVSLPAQVGATSVPLLLPSAIAFDADGNLYIAETARHVVRKVDRAGFITTVAGTGTQGYDGDRAQATQALLDSPEGLAVDATGLYIADTHNHRIRKVDLSNETITTIAGSSTAGATGDNGPALAATLDRPVAIVLDAKSNLYLADAGSHRIRRIDASTGTITTVAGDVTQGYSGDSGRATAALLDSPQGLAVDTNGNLYLADTHNQRIRRVDGITGVITTVAGTGAFGYAGDSGVSTKASLALPRGLSMDQQGNLYLADSANHRIRRIDAATGAITTVIGDGTQGFAGDGGAPDAASLDAPRTTAIQTTAINPSGLVTVADTGNQRVRQDSGTTLQTIAGLSGAETQVTLSITSDAAVTYGSGTVTATLLSPDVATGAITFSDRFAGATGSAIIVPLSSNAAILDTSLLPAGPHILSAAYGGDSSHIAAQSVAFPLTVNPLPITAMISPASLQYGEEIPAILGGLTGVLPRDQSSVAVTVSADVPAHPSAGTYPVGTALTGAASGNYTLSAQPTLTITKARTATALTATTATLATATSVDAGQPVLLSVHVASATSGTPTGIILLSDGGTLLTAGGADASGNLTFATSALGTGPHSLSAAYSGDTNFLSSTSPTALFTVNTPQVEPGDFTLASSSATAQTIVSGGSANFSFVVNTQGGLSSPVTLAASGLPDLATASFNPGSVPPGTVSGSFTMTIQTPKTAQRVQRGDSTVFAWLILPFVAFALRKPRHAPVRILAIVLLAAPLFFATGCGDRVRTGSNAVTPTKSYTITVTGTALDNAGVTLRHTTTVTLTLQAAS
jgi:sugar lactone lactonase YvrE